MLFCVFTSNTTEFENFFSALHVFDAFGKLLPSNASAANSSELEIISPRISPGWII